MLINETHFFYNGKCIITITSWPRYSAPFHCMTTVSSLGVYHWLLYQCFLEAFSCLIMMATLAKVWHMDNIWHQKQKTSCGGHWKVHKKLLHVMEMMGIHLMASLVVITFVYHFIGFVMEKLTVKVSVCFVKNRFFCNSIYNWNMDRLRNCRYLLWWGFPN